MVDFWPDTWRLATPRWPSEDRTYQVKNRKVRGLRSWVDRDHLTQKMTITKTYSLEGQRQAEAAVLSTITFKRQSIAGLQKEGKQSVWFAAGPDQTASERPIWEQKTT